jgi:hypothetical protein
LSSMLSYLSMMWSCWDAYTRSPRSAGWMRGVDGGFGRSGNDDAAGGRAGRVLGPARSLEKRIRGRCR